MDLNIGATIVYYLRYALRLIVGLLDGFIYTISAEIYDLMIKIAEAEIFTDDTLTSIAGRVYQLLVLIMMFRLISVFIGYVVNPDDMVHKEKGYQKVITKMIVSIALIIITPWAFDQARNIQTVVIDEGVIDYLVFGTSAEKDVSNGYRFMYTVGKLFIIPQKTVDGKQQECPLNWDDDNECRYGAQYNSNLLVAFDKAITTQPNGKKDLRALMSLPQYGDPTANNNEGEFYVNYRFPFVGSTLVGVVIGYMLLIMCIDIALRSVKLAFYEIIAPIPIIANIGPKSGKDSMLGKWLNAVLKTYVDLFIRVAGLQLAALAVSYLIEPNTFEKNDFFVTLFLIIGALTFAKKLPDILKEFGIKFETGGFSLKKKLEPAMSMVRPLTGAAAGALGGMFANAQASNAVKRGLVRGGASALGGALTGAVRGAAAGAKQKNGLGLGAGFGAAGKSGQKIIKNDGTTLGGRMIAGAQQRLGLDTKADRLEKEFEKQDKWQKARESLESYASKQAAKNPTNPINTVKYRNAQGQEVEAHNVNLAQAQARLTTLKSGNAHVGGVVRGVTYRDANGNMVTGDVNLDSIQARRNTPSSLNNNEIVSRRANLEAERAQGYVASDELRQRRANLEAERQQGYAMN